jgi:hypothetical protein
MLVLSGLAILLGCAVRHPDAVERAALDVPRQFMVESGGALVAPATPGASPGTLIDPRNGRKLMLLRSANGIGDYLAPAGTYGLQAGELLRIDFRGQPMGIVRR